MLIAKRESFDNATQSRKNTKNTFNVITFNETKLKHHTQKVMMFYYNK